MSESIKAYGKILGETNFEFTLDGMASYGQMKRLIDLTDAVAKKLGANATAANKQEKAEKDELDLLIEKNKQTEKSIDLEDELRKSSGNLDEKVRDISKTFRFFKGDFSAASNGYTTQLTVAATAVGTLFGALNGYADQLQLGLQRGVSGGIMDFAIAAKTGGVSLGSFSKALEESGGGFASLGNGATEGAKNFGALIGSVRGATASVGNLGLSNDQLAMFTAQQVKVAVAQGFKGKVAQDVVIRNTTALAKELDILANQTGKSVLEMTQAAVKLAQDPLVSSFVRDVKMGGADAAKALNSYAANFSALFGKEGDKLARDTLGPALAGLPMIINDTGKNLALASQSTFNELNRLAQKAKNKEQMTDEDRQRLSETIKKEMTARGGELRMMAELGGPMGDSAKQFLALAQEVENYNSAAGAERRKEDKAAQEFNTAMNKLKANMMALSIPFLNFVNGIPWDSFITTLNVFVDAIAFLLKPLAWLGKVLGATIDITDGFGISLGKIFAVAAGIGTAFVVMSTGITLVKDVFAKLSGTTLKFDVLLTKLNAHLATMTSAGRGKPGLAPGSLSDWQRGAAKGTGGAMPAPSSKGYSISEGGILIPADHYKPDAGKIAAPEKSTGKISGSLSNPAAGSRLGKLAAFGANNLTKLSVGGLVGGMAVDYAGDKLKENGFEDTGKSLKTAGGMASGAMTGAMLGAFFGPGGAVVGAIGGAVFGGISTAMEEWGDSEKADGIASADAEAVDQSNRNQSASLEQQQAMVREFRQLREDIGYGNSIAARQVSVAETGNRQLSNMQLGTQ